VRRRNGGEKGQVVRDRKSHTPLPYSIEYNILNIFKFN